MKDEEITPIHKCLQAIIAYSYDVSQHTDSLEDLELDLGNEKDSNDEENDLFEDEDMCSNEKVEEKKSKKHPDFIETRKWFFYCLEK